MWYAETSGSDSESKQHKSGSRRQTLRKAFQLLSPSYEAKDKGGHMV